MGSVGSLNVLETVFPGTCSLLDVGFCDSGRESRVAAEYQWTDLRYCIVDTVIIDIVLAAEAFGDLLEQQEKTYPRCSVGS